MRTVPDIHGHSALESGPNHRMNFTGFGGDEAAGMAGKGMRQDVAGLHQRHHRSHHLIGVDAGAVLGRPELTEMDVERQAGLTRDLLG